MSEYHLTVFFADSLFLGTGKVDHIHSRGHPYSLHLLILRKEAKVPTHFCALRLIKLSNRPLDLLKTSAMDTLLHSDPLIAIFHMFAELNASLSIEPFELLTTGVTGT